MISSPKSTRIPWLLYWRTVLLVIAAVTLPPPSPVRKMPLPSDEPEFGVAATPIVLLRTRAFRFPRVVPTDVERTSIASPFEPFKVLLRISTVWVPTEVVTSRLPPAAAPAFAFAPVLSKLLPSARTGPPITASMVEPELAIALIQSARAPLMSDDFNVKFKVVPALFDEIRMLLLPLTVLLRPKVLLLIVSRFSVPVVFTSDRLSSKPPSITQEVIAAVPVRLLKPTAPSSSAALLPLVPVTVENSRV